jgi:hypothetical protein
MLYYRITAQRKRIFDQAGELIQDSRIDENKNVFASRRMAIGC